MLKNVKRRKEKRESERNRESERLRKQERKVRNGDTQFLKESAIHNYIVMNKDMNM